MTGEMWVLVSFAWAVSAVLNYGLAVNYWYQEFGPSQHGGSGRYRILPWNERERDSLRRDARGVLLISLLGPIALFATATVWCFIADTWGLMYRWPAEFYKDKP